MFSLGGLEWVLIILFAFLIFGPDKLPQVAKTAGKYIRQFKTIQEQMSKTVQSEIVEPLRGDLDPLVKDLGDLKNPLDGIKNPFDDLKNPFEDVRSPFESLSRSGDSAKKGDKSKKPSGPSEPSAEELEALLPGASTYSAGQETQASSNQAAEFNFVPPESFAQRRARLEQDYARKKAAAAGFDSTKASAVEEAAAGIDGDTATSAGVNEIQNAAEKTTAAVSNAEDVNGSQA